MNTCKNALYRITRGIRSRVYRHVTIARGVLPIIIIIVGSGAGGAGVTETRELSRYRRATGSNSDQ